MKSILTVCLWILGTSTFMCAQRSAVNSAIPDTSRYEIVQAPDAVRYTFKLDKFTGRVFQLTDTSGGNQDRLVWREMLVLDAPKVAIPSVKPSFQIFISGIGIRYTFLLDVTTGKTWIFAKGTNPQGESIDVWSPVDL